MSGSKTLNVKGLKIQLIKGVDILKEKSDAVVIPVDNYLELYRGGIAGQVSQQGGESIQNFFDDWIQENQFLPTGDCITTSPGDLKCQFKYIIYTPGPVWKRRNNDIHSVKKELCNCIKNSL